MENNLVGIILVNWNNYGDVLECIDSILGSNSSNFHIYIVDNCSTDDSVEKIKDWCDSPKSVSNSAILGVNYFTQQYPGNHISFRYIDNASTTHGLVNPSQVVVTIIKSNSNLGFAGGNNIGMKLAMEDGCRWYWLLNTDTVIHKDALNSLLMRGLQNPEFGMIGSTLCYYDQPSTVQALGGVLDYKTTSVSHLGEGLELSELSNFDVSKLENKLSYIVGASMFLSYDFLCSVGFMEEEYFLYFEEIDYAFRSKDLFKLAWSKDSLVWHKVGRSSAKVASLFSLQYIYKNRIKFVKKFLPSRLNATRVHLFNEMVRLLIRQKFKQAILIFKVIF